MSQVRKTSSTSPAHGPIDLAERRRQAESAEPSAKSADQARVSESARELARAHGAVEASPEVRAERVAQLKAQIADGNYNPDPKEVAKKLLERGF
ncbi:MAG: flagellar biosynthesis anti-sigma factor FlgM [Dehalococcoidia bacterium]